MLLEGLQLFLLLAQLVDHGQVVLTGAGGLSLGMLSLSKSLQERLILDKLTTHFECKIVALSRFIVFGDNR